MNHHTQKLDLRFQRTRKSLWEALTTLMKKKGVEQISVTELSKLAGVNRATFYLHYRTPSDILEDIYQSFIEEFSAAYGEKSVLKAADMVLTRETWRNIYRFLAEKRETVRLLTGIGYRPVQQSFESRLLSSVLERRLWRIMELEIPAKYYFASHISAWTAILRLWLQNSMMETPEEITDITMACRLPFSRESLYVSHDEANSPF